MTIPHSLPSIDEKDIEAVVSVLRSKNLQDGALVGELEQIMTEWLKVPYAISTANGFGAINLALLALDIQKGDEVIIPSYTCSALLHPISLVGAKPIITDIGKNSFNATLQSIKEKSSNRTRAIILPHTFGFPVNDIQAVKELGIPLIEVCAQAIGGSLKGQKLGSFGDISIFSFYASKVICGGDGGMLMTKDSELAKSARDYRIYNGIKGRSQLTLNYRLTNLPAQLVISQLKKLPFFLEKRKELACQYFRYLRGHENIHLSWEGEDNSIFYRFPIAIKNRELIKKRLKERGINTGYGVLENMHGLLSEDNLFYPHAEKRIQEVLSLPIYPDLSLNEVKWVSDNVMELTEKKHI